MIDCNPFLGQWFDADVRRHYREEIILEWFRALLGSQGGQ